MKKKILSLQLIKLFNVNYKRRHFRSKKCTKNYFKKLKNRQKIREILNRD